MLPPTYNAQCYEKHRPTYPTSLYEKIFVFHKGKWELSLDVGTGTGQSAITLARTFQRVDAVDVSQDMLDAAKAKTLSTSNISFTKCSAESIHELGFQYDLITASEAAHWFDMDKFYDSCKLCLAPNGTIAIWAYSLFQLADYGLANKLIWNYSNVTLGPFWDPRRRLLDELYADAGFEDRKNMFQEWQRILFDGTENPIIMSFTWSLEDLGLYLKTWSPYRSWKENSGARDLDLVDSFIEDLKDALKRIYAIENITSGFKVKVDFPMVLILARNK